ncbi:MAG: DUF1573 domain-containing protein [Deltaproteobacteria bacterium]|nr:MAG: DUF1573 domain-containing protein [Deltaproteobacteria bacterium]
MTEFDKVIPPGGVGKVKASLDTTHYKGPISKGITVTTNDGSKKPVVLQLKVEVVTAIDVQPTDTISVAGKVGALKPTEVTVSSTDGRSFEVLAVKADPSLAVSVKPAADHNGARRTASGGAVASGASRYVVTITPKADVAVGRSVASVTLTTNHPGGESVPVQIILVVSGDVLVSPETLVLEPRGTDDHVKISKAQGEVLKILGVESSDPDFVPSVRTVVKGREYDIVVRYVGKPNRGVVRSSVTVKTNDRHQRSIVIPVVGAV